MGDTFELDQGDRETLRGTLHDPQATAGDVLTVQAADPADISGTFQGLYTGFNAAQTINNGDTQPGQAVPGGPGVYGAGVSVETIAWTYNVPGTAPRNYPCRLAAGFPVYVVVSQDGTPTGGPCGGAAGAGHAVLLIGTP